MGLDQCVYFRKKQELEGEPQHRQADMYFRKNRHLQGYMEDIWEALGNTGEFNCVSLFVTGEDLDNLKKENLRDAKGFFWGERSLEEDWREIEQFKEKAYKALKRGDKIEYFSWW